MKPKTVKQLRNKVDKARREYIRKRDTDWRGNGVCISCGILKPVEQLQVGHYYKRQYDFTTELGGEERNVNLQCEQCNGYRGGNEPDYAIGLIKKYGKGILEELQKKRRTDKKWKLSELEALISDYQNKLKEDVL